MIASVGIALIRLLCRPILIIIALSTVPGAHAQEVVLELDPAKTEIDFALSATLHTVHGTFKLKTGAIRFDPVSGSASGLIVVDATSGQTGNPRRDRKMHHEVLESESYPEITFTPKRIVGSLALEGESQAGVEGVMKLHGSEHKTMLQARVRVSQERANAEIHLVIPYVEWGLKNPSSLFLRVSDTVDMDVRGSGRLTGLSAHH